MPGNLCAVTLCNNKQTRTNKYTHRKVRYHLFPKDETSTRFKKWALFCRRKDKIFNPKTARICSDHFAVNAYKRDLKSELLGESSKLILEDDAVPTIEVSLEQSSAAASDRVKRTERRQSKAVVAELLQTSRATTPPATTPAELPEPGSVASPASTIGDNSAASPIDSGDNSCIINPLNNYTLQQIQELEKRIDALLKLNYQKNKENEELSNKVKMLEKDLKQCKSKLNTAQTKLITKRHAIFSLKRELQNLKQMHAKATVLNNKLTSVLRTVFTETQVDMLLKNKKKPSQWDDDSIVLAFTLRYLSKRTYLYLKKNMNIPLPGISTLATWVSKFDVFNGIFDQVLQCMEIVGKTLTERERIAVIDFDEVILKKTREYNAKRDEIVGPHSQLQVIMVRGLFSTWKQPVFAGCDTKVTKELLLDIITRLQNVGYRVVACVSDMGGGNQGLWKELGISVNNTHFFHPVLTDKKIYCFGDAPHQIKLIRNWLLDKGFIFNDGVEITKKPLEKLVKTDSNEYQACYPLDELHLNCENNERQNVSLACQLLSRTVAITVREDKNKLGNEVECERLADFIETTNDWFDVMNSYHKYESFNDFNCGYGVHFEQQNEALDRMYNMINEVRASDKKGLQVFQSSILVSITSLKNLLIDVRADFGDDIFLLTHKLNQDCLENFFSTLRQRGGTYDHPSALNALYRIRLIILGKMAMVQKKLSTKFESDDGDFLVSRLLLRSKVTINDSLIEPCSSVCEDIDLIEQNENKITVNNDLNESEPDKSTKSDKKTKKENITKKVKTISKENKTSKNKRREIVINMCEMEKRGQRYVAGWVAKKHKFNYPELGTVTLFKKGSKGALPTWIDFLSRGGLTEPSDAWLQCVIDMEADFQIYHGKNTLKKGCGVIKGLLNILKNKYNFPEKVLHTFARIRTFIRMKFLDKKEINDKLRERRLRKERIKALQAKKQAQAKKNMIEKIKVKAKRQALQEVRNNTQNSLERKRARKIKKY